MKADTAPAPPAEPPAAPAPPANPETPAAPPAPAPAPATEEDPATAPPAAPPAEASSPSAPARMNAFQRGALRALGIGELVQRVEAAEAMVGSLTTENARLMARNAALEAELPRREQAARTQRENEVSQQSRAVLSSLGVSAADAPAQVPEAATPAAMLEKFATLKGAEKTAFFRAHKATLKAAQASAAPTK